MTGEIADAERIEKLIGMVAENIATLFGDLQKLGTEKDTYDLDLFYL